MVERVLVIDAGESATLLLVAEHILGEIQIRHHVSIPKSLGAPEQLIPETIAQLRAEHDPLKVILILPQSETVSQRIVTGNQEITEFVAQEASRFQQIQGDEPVFDHQLLQEKPEKSYWLSYCQPRVIEDHLARLGLTIDDLDDVTSAAQGLWGFFESSSTSRNNAYVIDVGRQHSSVMQIRGGQPVFATSFVSTVENPHHLVNNEALDRWFDRLESARSTLQGIAKRPIDFEPDDEIILTGDDRLLQPIELGLQQRVKVPLRFAHPAAEDDTIPGDFGNALGVARSSLGASSLRISLLPQEHRLRSDQRVVWNRLRGWTSVLALIGSLLLLIGSWQKFTLLRFKKDLLANTQIAIEKMARTEQSLVNFAGQYERVRPILRFQQETRELIDTLAILQASSGDPSYWLVLLADYDSYNSKALNAGATNSLEILSQPPLNTRLGNASGFVAEFSFIDEGEAMRSKLVALVKELNQAGIYANVDTLPEDVRRPLAHTNVVLENRHVALSLQLERNVFKQRLALAPSPASDTTIQPTEADTSFLDRKERIPEVPAQP